MSDRNAGMLRMVGNALRIGDQYTAAESPLQGGCPPFCPGDSAILRRMNRPIHTALFGVLAAILLAGGRNPARATSVYDIQYTAAPSGDSPLAGEVVTVSGIVTAVMVDGFTIADSAGAWRGVYVYTVIAGPAVGDSVEVTGTVQEYYGMTEIANVTTFAAFSSGHPVPPLDVEPADAPQEAYESVLLRVDDVTVTELLPFGEWTVDSVLVCDDVNDYVYFPRVGDALDSVTGVLQYSFGAFKLQPRETADIAGAPIAHYALGGDVVTMNDNHDVLTGHYVEVRGDGIVAIHATMPGGMPVVETGALIFPGLIDAHNHAAYNVLGPIPFDTTFSDRYEWQATALYSSFRDQYNAIRDFGGSGAQTSNLHRLAELRALSAGTTTIQGVNCNGHAYDAFAHRGIGINNAERFPSRILSSVFPLSQGAAYWQARGGEYWNRFVVHLCEGTNQDAFDELAAWQALVPLDDRTTIIHGTALGANEWSSLAAAGGHLVWSPRSNVALYGETADIPGAMAAGVNIALAPDWTESGSPHLLDEMRFARLLADSLWGGAPDVRTVADMVTRNAAAALGAGNRIGRVAPGFDADLTVIAGLATAPYDALLDATPGDVALTVVSGRPMYGDPSLMGQFAFLDNQEDIVVHGMAKRLAVRLVAHAIPEAGVPTAATITQLESAYNAATPTVCCFLDLDEIICGPVAVLGDGPRGVLSCIAIHPNPFNPTTTIHYRIGHRQHVSVSVYDVRGVLIDTLSDRVQDAGPHAVSWNGRDTRGRAVASGVYFVHVRGDHGAKTAKAVLLK